MFDDSRPIYRQIEEQIKSEILEGLISADEQVMSTNQYASFYRINPATAQKAFQNLTDEGVLYKRRGLGMFVTADAREKLVTQLRARFFSDVLDPAIVQARAIGLTVDDVVTYVQGGMAAEEEQ